MEINWEDLMLDKKCAWLSNDLLNVIASFKKYFESKYSDFEFYVLPTQDQDRLVAIVRNKILPRDNNVLLHIKHFSGIEVMPGIIGYDISPDWKVISKQDDLTFAFLSIIKSTPFIQLIETYQALTGKQKTEGMLFTEELYYYSAKDVGVWVSKDQLAVLAKSRIGATVTIEVGERQNIYPPTISYDTASDYEFVFFETNGFILRTPKVEKTQKGLKITGKLVRPEDLSTIAII